MICTAAFSLFVLALLAPSAFAGSAYATHPGGDGVSVIDTATNQVVGAPIPVASPSAVAISPDGATAYVANDSVGGISVVDTATNQIVGMPISVAFAPTGIAITPDGKTAYVSSEGPGKVTVIETQTDQVTGSITVGTDPIGLATKSIALKRR